MQGKKIDKPLLIVDNLTAKLIDKLQANIWAEATALRVARGEHGQTHRWENFYGSGRYGKRGGATTSL